MRFCRSKWSGRRRHSSLKHHAAVLTCLVISSWSIEGCAEPATPMFSGGPAWDYLVKQCEFGPRVPGSAAHDNAVRFIATTLRDHGASVTVQRFEVDDPYGDRVMELKNIIGSYAPTTRRRLLLAAHFDSRPWADQETADSLRARPVPGANDGASGVAVLLEVAEIVSRRLPRNLGVDLVFFDGEDYGKENDLEHYLLGSKYFAANLGGYRPECGILLDMVGGDGAQIYKEGNSVRHAPRLTEELFERAERLGLDIFVPRRTGPIYDDHVPLNQAGIKTVDLIGLPYEYWHTVRDTPDKCSRETLRQVGMLLVDFIYDFGF